MKPQLVQEIRTAIDLANYAEALQKSQQLINVAPTNAEAYLLYGEVFLAMENPTKAIEQFERVITLQPDNAEAYFKLGNAYELREDEVSAINQYQTARRLDPSNQLYTALYGRLLNKKGLEKDNLNYENEGLALMEASYHAGVRDAALHEQLSIAHVIKATENWPNHPEEPNRVVPTEALHVKNAKIHLEWVRHLHDPSNEAIANRLAELDGAIRESEKRVFAGYPYLRKAPLIVGGILLLFGQLVAGIILLLMGVLYHISQIKPMYNVHRMLMPGQHRHPFIVRRLDQMDQVLSGITFFDSSLSRLMFNKFLFGFVISAMRYMMVIMMLPYEITKGFLVNHGLKEQLVAKMRSL